MIDSDAEEDGGQSSGDDSDEVAEVEVGGVTVQIPGETVLNTGPDEPGRETQNKVDGTLSFEKNPQCLC